MVVLQPLGLQSNAQMPIAYGLQLKRNAMGLPGPNRRIVCAVPGKGCIFTIDVPRFPSNTSPTLFPAENLNVNLSG